MAGKSKLIYICSQWNCMEEGLQAPAAVDVRRKSAASVGGGSYRLQDIDTAEDPRYYTGLSELDRVLGGGIVKGSLILISGDPGIGKSTMLLQICEYLGRSLRILYVSGEESVRQIKLRAQRLGVVSENLRLMAQTDIQYIVEHIHTEKPDLVMIDSIQTMNHTDVSSSPGSITQVRECTNAVLRCAKSLDIPIIIVGHVNKDGAIAGPKVLEHIVDAVLYFEGERQFSYRILRAAKNRYGSTNEIGVFDMTGRGLEQVENPSQAMLSGRPKNVSGTCVTCVMEGTRALLAEIQGLATSTGFGNPRRIDYNRMAMILAVLEKRAGYFFGNLDTYVNVVGGLRLDEPAVDLAVAMALVSSLKDVPIREDTMVIGEIGLAGEIRSVSNMEARIVEAVRLGFPRCVMPSHGLQKLASVPEGAEIVGVKDIRQAFEACTGG